MLGEANEWKLTWTNLPIYVNGSDTVKSVYTIVETGHNARYSYTVSPAESVIGGTVLEPEKAEAVVTNTYIPERGEITADKQWIDLSNLYKSRASQISLTLKYRVESTDEWKIVSMAGLNADGQYADGGVYTTSKPTQTLTGDGDLWTGAKWENLPVWIDVDGVSRKIAYKVFETDADGKDAELPGYTITYSADDGSTLNAGETAAQTVTNTLNETKLTVTKEWVGDEAVKELVRPVKVRFTVEYRHGESGWQKLVDAEGKEVVLTIGSDDWKGVIEHLPAKDAEGMSYEYRAQETELSYDGESFIKTQNGACSEYEWTGRAGAYDGSTKAAEKNGEWTISAVNTLTNASLTVSKNWKDDMNRDGKRPASIELQLMRDGAAFGEKVTVTADDSGEWKYEWTGLPVFMADGSGIKSVYSVVETPVEAYAKDDTAKTELTAGKNELTISNLYVPERIEVRATKVWNDSDNLYGTRTDGQKVILTLEYRVSGGEWKAVPTAKLDADSLYPDGGVYTTTVSNIAGYEANTLSTAAAEGDEAIWKDLPARCLLNGKAVEIEYRVVEEAVASYETKAEGIVKVSSKSYELNVTNTLIETRLTVVKNWVDQDNLYGTRPDGVVVRLERRTADSEWTAMTLNGEQTLTAENGWKLSWEHLPVYADAKNTVMYEYRAVETALIYGDQTISVSDENAPYTASAVHSAAKPLFSDTTVFTSELTNTLKVTGIQVTKKWKDEGNTYGYRPRRLKLTLTMQTGDWTFTPELVWEKRGSTWTAQIDGLPMYVPGTTEVAVYSVTEENVKYYKADKKTVVVLDGTAELINRLTKTPGDNPETGDYSQIFLWLALMILSGCTLVGLTVVMKKNGRKHAAKHARSGKGKN